MISVKAPEKYALYLRHLAEQFFDSTDGLSIEARISENKAFVSINSHYGEFNADDIAYNAHSDKQKLCLGRAFALAAQKTGVSPPEYGILTGVRPVKPAVNCFRSTENESFATAVLERDYLVSPPKAKTLTSLAKKELEYEKTFGKRDVLLYVSIPFCPTRCAYCSFISSSAPKHLKEIPQYLSALEDQLDKTGKLCRKHSLNVKAAYIGGGTPGVLNAGQLDSLLKTMHSCFCLENTELTCELGRPDTVNEAKLEALKKNGVHRISINPQTTNDRVLKLIGRTHSSDDFFRAFSMAKSFGFDSINTDLIAALPGDTPQSFCKSLNEVTKLSPENITVHSFCLKRSADFEKHTLCPTGEAIDMMRFSFDNCIKSGYEPYYLYRQKNSSGALENTGFALEGKDCIYNIAMMEDMLPVLAAGAGGITKLPGKRPGDKISRIADFKYHFEYLSQPEKTASNLALTDNLLEKYFLE